MFNNKVVLGVFASLCLTSAASASTFDFTGLGGQNNSSSITVLGSDGLVSATATLNEAVVKMARLQLGRELDAQTAADITAFLTALNHQP